MDQQVDTLGQLEHRGVDRVQVARRLVVADVRDLHPAPLDAVADGRPDVWHGADHDLRVADREVVGGHAVEVHVALELGKVDREVRRLHQPAEDLGQRPLSLVRAVHVEPRPGGVNGREERQALHVIPVDVGDEGGGGESLVDRHGGAEQAQTGAQIEEDRRFAVDLDRDGGSVAAVPNVVVARARATPPDAVKGDLQRSLPLLVSGTLLLDYGRARGV